MPIPSQSKNSIDDPWDDKTPGEIYPFSPEQKLAMRIRADFWNTLGRVDKPIVHSPSPIFGGENWSGCYPTWRVIHRANSVMVATDGLSNLVFDESWIELLGGKPRPLGVGVELFFEAAPDAAGNPPEWLMSLAIATGNAVSVQKNIVSALRDYGVLSLGVEVEDFPSAYKRKDGVVGLLLGLPAAETPKEIALPSGAAQLVCVTLLTPSEFAMIDNAHDKAKARKQIASNRTASTHGHWCRV